LWNQNPGMMGHAFKFHAFHLQGNGTL